MQRYFVNGELSNYELEDSDIFHIERVIRNRINDQIQLVIKQVVYLARIIGFSPLKLEIIKKLDENRELGITITLLYCLPKGDKLDLVVQKATELGVSKFVGVLSKYTVVKIAEHEIDKKLTRFRRIIKEASEQSLRHTLMDFSQIIDFKDITKFSADIKLMAYEKESLSDNSLTTEALKIVKGMHVLLLVGAEGGFSEEEANFACNHGFKSVSLGKRILRSETAAIAMISHLALMIERD